MKRANHTPYPIDSIAEMHRLLELPGPLHPLVSVLNLDEITCTLGDKIESVRYNFYSICIKKNFKGKMKYGQNYYDFDHGTMTFFSPGQVISTIVDDDIALSGCWLMIHPDFLNNYTLAKGIKEYGYFSYAVNEALHLSEQEDAMMTSVMQNISQEYRSAIDHYSQDVMIAHIALLLSYANRFYNRQFITRKIVNNDLLYKLDTLLENYFNSEKIKETGLPTVQYCAAQLTVSPNYLSDVLRSLTGQSTQQHIHNKLIEKAKEILTTTSLSVSEIAYQLGFEYPQSFNKLFRNKTETSPLEFRHSFN